MTVPRCLHLIDDLALGGITKSFNFFRHPAMAALARHKVVSVVPGWRLAPRFGAEIVVTHFPPSWRTMPYFISLRLRNRHAHLVHIEHSYTAAWERLKVTHRQRFRRCLRLALAMVDDVVAVSEGQGDWLADAGAIASAKLRVIYPWSGSQSLDKLEPAIDVGDRPIRLAAYGRFAEAKGFDVLIDAVRQLDPRDFSLVLGGFGPEDAALRARAAGCANIRFAGRIDDVAGFIAQSDVVVVPSRWEAFGQVCAEAKLAGRAVVVADVDGLTEQVGEAGIAVDCSAPEPLAQALASLRTRSIGRMAAAARTAMNGVELSRLGGWQTLFAGIATRQAAVRSTPTRAATPTMISAGQ